MANSLDLELEDDTEVSSEASLNSDLRDAFEEVTGEEAPAKDSTASNGFPSFGLPDKKLVEASPEKENLAPVAAPLSWSKEHRQEFEALPPSVQQIIAKRESEKEAAFTRAMQEASETKKQAKEIYEAIEPFRNRAMLQGSHLPTVLQRMLGWQEVLEADPVNGLIELARTLGVDPRVLAQQQQQQPGYSSEYAQLQRQIAELQNQLTEREQLQLQSQKQAVVSEIERFAVEVDATGNPVRPYFQRVAPIMQPIVERLRAEYPTASGSEILQQAYSDACYADPDVRDILLKQARQEEEAKQSAERRAKAAAARKAGSSVTGAPSGSIRTQTPGTVRSLIEQAWNESL